MTSELKLTARALAEKAAKTAEADAKAQAAALEAGAASDKEAAARSKAFMENWLAEHDDEDADAAQAAAMAAFETAVEADPVALAWLEVLRMHVRRYEDGAMAQNFSSLIGGPVRPAPAGGSPPQVSEALQRALVHLAQRLEGERTAAIFEAREAAAEGDA